MIQGERNMQLTYNNEKYAVVLDDNLTVYLLMTESAWSYSSVDGDWHYLRSQAMLISKQ